MSLYITIMMLSACLRAFSSGLTMYRNLPRHTFGFIQGKLFPKYFLLGTSLSSVTLASFLLLNPYNSWQLHQIVQVTTMPLVQWWYW